MPKPNILECMSCEGCFKVVHDMDENYYEAEFCVFCGTKLELEEELEIDYGDEEDY